MTKYYIIFDTVLNEIILNNESKINEIYNQLKKQSGDTISYRAFINFFERHNENSLSIMFYEKELASFSYFDGYSDKHLLNYIINRKKTTNNTYIKINLNKLFREKKLKNL